MRGRRRVLRPALARAAACLAAALLAGACGYRFVGSGAGLPDDVRTVYLERFLNRTRVTGLEHEVRLALRRELTGADRPRVVERIEDADAVLSGVIRHYSERTVAVDRADRVLQAEARLEAEVTLRRRSPPAHSSPGRSSPKRLSPGGSSSEGPPPKGAPPKGSSPGRLSPKGSPPTESSPGRPAPEGSAPEVLWPPQAVRLREVYAGARGGVAPGSGEFLREALDAADVGRLSDAAVGESARMAARKRLLLRLARAIRQRMAEGY